MSRNADDPCGGGAAEVDVRERRPDAGADVGRVCKQVWSPSPQGHAPCTCSTTRE